MTSTAELRRVFVDTSAWLVLMNRKDQDLSYVDALSLYVVQSHSDIDAIFAFDHHLALAGLPVFPGPL
jgi:predicted nucleic acid-binding protein